MNFRTVYHREFSSYKLKDKDRSDKKKHILTHNWKDQSNSMKKEYKFNDFYVIFTESQVMSC